MIRNSVKIAFYKGKYGNWIDKLICLFTMSKYSHCELIIDGHSYSSSMRDGGVRHKVIKFIPERWDFITIPVEQSDKYILWAFYKKTKKDKYDLLPILLYPIWKFYVVEDSDKWFCSEWVAQALNNAGFKIPKLLSPADLYEHFIKEMP